MLIIVWACTSYASFWINGSDPRTPAVYGLDLAVAGRHREALERYGEALALDGRFADAWSGAGASLGALGNDAEALRDFQECLKHNPRDAVCYTELAGLLAKQRRPAEALASVQRAAQVAPEHPVAYHLLGLLLGGQGRLPEAAAALREAVRMVPDNGTIHADLAKAYARQGEYRQAGEQFAYARRMSPNDAATKLITAWFLATCPEDSVRNGQLAAQLAEEVLRQQGQEYDRVLALDSLAAGHAEAGRFEEAVKAAGRLLEELEGARRTEQAAKVRARLDLYNAHKPYREIASEQKAP
jgi:tetratricopeptide (TPR) repeat protein